MNEGWIPDKQTNIILFDKFGTEQCWFQLKQEFELPKAHLG